MLRKGGWRHLLNEFVDAQAVRLGQSGKAFVFAYRYSYGEYALSVTPIFIDLILSLKFVGRRPQVA